MPLSPIVHDHQGELIYYDTDESTLRRSLPSLPGAALHPLRLRDGQFCILTGGEIVLPDLSLVEVRDGVFGIKRGDHYATSVMHTDEVLFSASEIHGWECFGTTEAADFDTETLAGTSWLRTLPCEIVPPQAIYVQDSNLAFGDLRYDLQDNAEALGRLGHETMEIVLHRGLQMDRFLRFRPLIYYVIFGPDEQFDLFRASLDSFCRIGGYQGDVCVITDRADLSPFMPASFTGKLIVTEASAGSIEAMWRARYGLHRIAELESYQPILYVDTDIVCNAPVQRLLERIALSTGVCAGTENHPGCIMIPSLYDSSEAVGKAYFERDGVLPDVRFGFNSGIIGFRNIETVRSSFSIIERTLHRMIVTGNPSGWADQAVANYVLNKLRLFDGAAISAAIAVGSSGKIYPYYGAQETPTLIHFWAVHRHERTHVIKSYIARRLLELQSDVPVAG